MTNTGVMHGLSRASSHSGPEEVPDVDVKHLDYEYIKKCTDKAELKNILLVLRSGKEGLWPDLETFAEKHYLELLSARERKLYIAQHSEASADEKRAASDDVASFLSDIKAKDAAIAARSRNDIKCDAMNEASGAIFNEKMASRAVPTSRPLPPVRNAPRAEPTDKAAAIPAYEAISEDEAAKLAKKRDERLSGYDWRGWEKYDVDAELDKLEKEEERSKRQIEESAKAEERRRAKRIAGMQAEVHALGLKLDISRLSDQERSYLAEKEKQKGNECYKAGEYDDAELFYSKAIVLDPQNHVFYANRAMVRLKTKQFERAEEDCSRAIEIDPTYGKAISRRAMTRHRRGKYHAAIEDFEAAIKLQPENKELRRLLDMSRKKYNEVGGIGAPKVREVVETEKFTRLAIEEDSDSDSESESDSDSVPPEKDAKHGSKEWAAKPVSETDSASGTWSQLKNEGTACFKAGDVASALQKYSEALSLAQDLKDTAPICTCAGNIALCHLQMGSYEKVVEFCDLVLSKQPQHTKCLLRKGTALEKMGKLSQALDAFCEVLNRDPDQTDASDAMDRIMRKMRGKEDVMEVPSETEEPPRVVADADTAEATLPKENVEQTFLALKTEGNAHFKAKRFAEAIERYTACVKTADRYEAMRVEIVAVLANRALSHLKTGDFDSCIEDCSDALSRLESADLEDAVAKPLRVKLHYRRAMGYDGCWQRENALADPEKVLHVEPGNKKAAQEMDRIQKYRAQKASKSAPKVSSAPPAAPASLLSKAPEQNPSVAAQDASMKKAAQVADAAKSVLKSKKRSLRPPKNGYDFERTWRSIKDDLTLVADYIELIPPHDFAKKLFRVEIPEEILVSLGTAILTHTAKMHPQKAFDALRGISRIRGLRTAVMFMSQNDKDVFRSAIDAIERHAKGDTASLRAAFA